MGPASTLAVLLTLLAPAAAPQAGDRVPPLPRVEPLEPVQQQYLRGCLDAFCDPDPARRTEAVLRVAQAGPVAVPLVVRAVVESSNPLMHRSGLMALGEEGGAPALAVLRSWFEQQRFQPDEDAVLALWLGRHGAGPAIERLREEARARRPSLLRRAAALSLGRLADVEGLRAALPMLPREPLEAQRAALTLAAAVTGDRTLLPLVLPGLEDRGPRVRRAAAFAAGEAADPVALPPLLAALRRERDDEVRRGLALALGRLDDEASRTALLDLVRDRAPAVREAALVACAHRGLGTRLIERALGRSGPGLDAAFRARLALACAGAPRASEAAAAAAEGGDEAGPAALDGALAELLRARDAAVRAAAGLALASRGARGTDDALIEWLEHERDPEARHDALLAVGVLGIRRALEQLEGAEPRDREDPWVDAVRRTLDGRRDPRLLEDALDQRLHDEGARLDDRRDLELAALVGGILELDDVVRAVAGSSEGGPRLDVRPAAVERDIAAWFEREPYFPRRAGP